jgi:hypothetical protein
MGVEFYSSLSLLRVINIEDIEIDYTYNNTTFDTSLFKLYKEAKKSGDEILVE